MQLAFFTDLSLVKSHPSIPNALKLIFPWGCLDLKFEKCHLLSMFDKHDNGCACTETELTFQHHTALFMKRTIMLITVC